MGRIDVPHGSGARDRRARDGGRRGREEVQGGRPGGHRRDGRLLPHLRELQGRPRELLREAVCRDVQREGLRRSHRLRWLLQQHRLRRALRAYDLAEVWRQAGRRRPAPLRGDYDLLADAALGRRAGKEGRRGRPRRARTHGPEVCALLWGACGAIYDFGIEDRRRQAPRRGRGSHLEGPRRDGEGVCGGRPQAP